MTDVTLAAMQTDIVVQGAQVETEIVVGSAAPAALLEASPSLAIIAQILMPQNATAIGIAENSTLIGDFL